MKNIYLLVFFVFLKAFPQAPASVAADDNKSRLIKKANDLFDITAYAKAAELYEQALKNPRSRSHATLERVADAYFYNTNVKKASEWYSVLYKEYRRQLSPQTLFKYSHALKGVGKTKKSKRILREYKKMQPGDREIVMPKDTIIQNNEEVDVKNLSINSKYSDFAPMFGPDGGIVFASSKEPSGKKYKWNQEPFLDIFSAQFNMENYEFSNEERFSKNINTKYHEAGVSFSPDGNTMYFTRNNYRGRLRHNKEGISHLKIYFSKKVDGKWGKAKELPFNSDDYSAGHPAVSADGKKLYFSSDMPGSLGKTDIFVVDILGNGAFSKPKNLGPKLNTPHREMFPYVSENKLFFASDGRHGLGGLDIYEAFLLEEGVTAPTNMGHPINSNKDDFSLIVQNEGEWGYFASNREGGKGKDDIYAFFGKEVEATAFIDGTVTDNDTKEPLSNAVVSLFDAEGALLKEVATDEDGRYTFEGLTPETTYGLTMTNSGHVVGKTQVTTLTNTPTNGNLSLIRENTIPKDLEGIVVEERGEKKFNIENILFGFDKDVVGYKAASEIDKIVSVMKTYKNMVIRIESHTDAIGSAAYNQDLSDRRAKSTRDYLIANGIEAHRISSAMGYGESKLLNDCDGTIRCSGSEHRVNRRSVFIIENM